MLFFNFWVIFVQIADITGPGTSTRGPLACKSMSAPVRVSGINSVINSDWSPAPRGDQLGALMTTPEDTLILDVRG
jgi:hypothetical protein